MNWVIQFFKDYDRSTKMNIFERENGYKVHLWLWNKKHEIDQTRVYRIDFLENNIQKELSYMDSKTEKWDSKTPMNKKQRDKVKKLILKMCLKKGVR